MLSFSQFMTEKDPCWKGYKQLGMKKKSGREVPNCVPVSEGGSMEEALSSSFWKAAAKGAATKASRNKTLPPKLKFYPAKEEPPKS